MGRKTTASLACTIAFLAFIFVIGKLPCRALSNASCSKQVCISLIQSAAQASRFREATGLARAVAFLRETQAISNLVDEEHVRIVGQDLERLCELCSVWVPEAIDFDPGVGRCYLVSFQPRVYGDVVE